ncbi:MAG TPA: hypothetical protein VJZ49_13690 [Syntrophales bacterium]|nr:hypothetical protein [Syntrophales bacterium]
MKGDQLPAQDHVARYCGYSTLAEDGSVLPAAFRLRKEAKESYLSVQWLECLQKSDRLSEVQEVRRILSGKNFRLGATAKIAVINVGTICCHVEVSSRFKIRVLHEPESDDISHSGIYDTIQDERMISELITEKVLETHPAVLPH